VSVLKPISITSLVDEALAKIVSAITSGEFEPGQRISEAQLARSLGISRAPLREALGRLEGSLVAKTPRVGVRVISLSHSDLAELFVIREALECMACRLAAQHITDAEYQDLVELLNSHHHNPSVLSRSGYFQRSKDDDFHFRIMQYARNERLKLLLMQNVYYQLHLYRFRASTELGRPEIAFSEHEAIVRAIGERDQDKAEQLMRLHIRNSFASLAKAQLGQATPDIKVKPPSKRSVGGN
jgi:DNA-binding GntR family transcriptional regulator